MSKDIKSYVKLIESVIKEDSEKRFKPPKAAQRNAQRALDYREKHGDEVKAGTRVGWTRANQLARGDEVSLDILKRMAQFNRHRKNSTISDKNKDEPWKDNGYVAWLLWGGDEGVDWAIRELEKLDGE